MLEDFIHRDDPAFTTCDQARPDIAAMCERHADIARFESLGSSEQGRPLDAAVIGRGDQHVSLLAGAHADEPVGPQVLRALCTGLLEHRQRLAALLDRVTFVIVPHVNPDGEAANQPWIEQWPDPLAMLAHAVREPPGRDVEFGYPDMRPENRAVADLLESFAPFNLHFSLHGMAVSEGAWLLIDRHWIDRTADLRRRWLDAVAERSLPLLDWDREGEKGFDYIGPGFSTTPRGEAMRQHFQAIGDADTARLFHDSSMEYVRRLGGDPLCLVTELPLFLLRSREGADVEIPASKPGEPTLLLHFKQHLPRWRAMLDGGRVDELAKETAPFELEPLPLATAARLQLRLIDLALHTLR